MAINAVPQMPFLIADPASPEYVLLDEEADENGRARITGHTRHVSVRQVPGATLCGGRREDYISHSVSYHLFDLHRPLLDRYGIGWSYWSFNDDYAVMTSSRTPSGPANEQTPDKAILHALMPDKYPPAAD